MFSLSLPLLFVHLIAVRILPPLKLLLCVGVVGDSISDLLNDKLNFLSCPVVTADDFTGSGEGISMHVGDERGVKDAIVPPTPVLDVVEEVFCGAAWRVCGMFFAATAMAGLWGEPIAMTKGMSALEAALSLRSGRDEDWVCKL